MQPGRGLGDNLNDLLELVLNDPDKNEKEILLNFALSHPKA
jgi:hypothetical protein